MLQQEWQTYLASAPEHGTAAGPALAWVATLAPMRFSGADTRKFLQGYLTCDTADLEPGRLTPTALCNLKGRVVMNGWCTPDGEQDVILLLHESLVETLQQFLRAYLMFSKTTLSDERERLLVLAGLDLADRTTALVMDERRSLFLLDDLDRARTLWESYPHMTQDAWLATLAADGIPLVSAPVSEQFLPQMLDLQTLGAIDFAKGCYLGQEVVARAQHRGTVKRRLARLAWQGARMPAAGAEVTDDSGRGVGVILQSAPGTAGEGTALAVLKENTAENLKEGDVDLRSLR